MAFDPDKFLSSPGLAMANSAMQNLEMMNASRLPTQNPVQAYQQAVNARALLSQQQQAERRANEMHAQRMDPAHGYKRLVSDGLVNPDETSYEDYQLWGGRQNFGTSAQQNLRTHMMLNPQLEGESDEAYQERMGEAFANYARASMPLDLGGGGRGAYNPISGANTVLVGPDTATGREARLESATTTAQEMAGSDAQQVSEGRQRIFDHEEAYEVVSSQIQDAEAMLQGFEDGNFDTGPMVAFLANTFGIGPEELGRLSAEDIEQRLNNLQITNLAPVTENELRLIGRLYIDIARGEEINKGAIKRAIEKMNRQQSRLEREARNSYSRINQYDREGGTAQSILDASPWMRNLINPQTKIDNPVAEPVDEFEGWSITPGG